eukprot:TRINITY_DN17482_c0_g2_i2.p1 TRINITY_DN17482_c0_g2~~TRINITY_DN17482_c0_g2_i2.p1  ORF type:complete len:115 (-),score=29.39 TRINITY_DN17482_c0_g2_i2:22-366(-)
MDGCGKSNSLARLLDGRKNVAYINLGRSFLDDVFPQLFHETPNSFFKWRLKTCRWYGGVDVASKEFRNCVERILDSFYRSKRSGVAETPVVVLENAGALDYCEVINLPLGTSVN